MQEMNNMKRKKNTSCARKCLLGALIYTLVLLLLVFFVVFVIVPIAFKYSVAIQRSLIFPSWMVSDKNYSDFEQFGLKGAKNFYVTVDANENVTLGCWQILSEDLLSEFIPDENYDFDGILAKKKRNVLLYFHGNGNDRAAALDLYAILRRDFLIISCDYRGYGDSTVTKLTEDLIVNDSVALYNWLRRKTEARIFMWGHSLGTGVSTHTISNLKTYFNATPSGLVLETPFSSVIDVIDQHFIITFFSWLPWYKSTILEPFQTNNFNFDPEKYIVDVDCPVMILHAKDDTIIPYELATKLYKTAINHRNSSTIRQGNVTYHLFEALGYDHMRICDAPELPEYIREFVEDCVNFESDSIRGAS